MTGFTPTTISRHVVTAQGLSSGAAVTHWGKHSSFTIFQAKLENLEEITWLSTFPSPFLPVLQKKRPEDAVAAPQSEKQWEAAA